MSYPTESSTVDAAPVVSEFPKFAVSRQIAPMTPDLVREALGE